MRLQMQDFAARGGQALFLGTEYASVAYKMYAAFGFASIEAASGYMAYYGKSQAEFEQSYFAPSSDPTDVLIQPLQWMHWPLSAALFLGDFPGIVRAVRMQIFGRQSSEGGLLDLLLESEKREQQGKQSTTAILQKRVTRAVVGLATYTRDPLWPDTYLADIYCHPAYWEQAPALLEALLMPTNQRVVAYVDADHDAKIAALTAAGFQSVTRLPNWLAADEASNRRVDVLVMVRA